jgi:sn-glycerol 3-phosphate transport system permease protein
MVESRPLEKALFHVTLIVGIAIITFPIFIALVASSHEAEDVMTTVRGWFGGALLENYATVLKSGKGSAVGVPVALMMGNSFVMSMGIVIGKIAISILSAYAIVYFRFPLRKFFFWIIFMTLMLAVEVHILPSQFVNGLIETEK